MSKAKNISLSSPIFEIDPSESYVIECDLSKGSDAKCENEAAVVPLQDGVGLRMTFYDSSQTKLTSTSEDYYVGKELSYDPRENHLVVSSSSVPIIADTGNDGVAIRESGFALKKVITYEKIPPNGAFATVDTVAYNHLVGQFFWSNVSAKTMGEYYYCLNSHADSSPNPRKSDNWTREFKFSPSYGSSVDFNCEVNMVQMANGYKEVRPQNTNHISAKFNLQFNNRSEREAKSITHFLEDNLGANKFFFTPPYPYDKKIEVVCESFSSNRQFSDSNDINAVFIADNIDSLNWKNAISPYSGDWDSSTNYQINDFVQYANNELRNHDSYYYARKDSSNSLPNESPASWSQDYFFWTPSLQQNISFQPRINKIELENKFAQRSVDGINTNLPALNSSYSNRTDREAAAITHFLQHKLGYQPFTTIRAKDFANKAHLEISSSLASNQKIYISGEETATVNLSAPISIPSQVGTLEIDQEITFPSVSSAHNKVYLTQALTNGATSMTVRSIDYADIPNGSNFDIFSSTSRVYCPSWTHTWNFKDNNSISTNFIECLFNKPVPNLNSGYYIEPDLLDYGLVGFNSFKDKKITIHNTGGIGLPLNETVINSDDAQFYLTSADPGIGNKYVPIEMPYNIAGQTSKSFFIRFRPKKLNPYYFSGQAVITIGGASSTVNLTGLTEGNFIVTGHDNIHPSGLTQIILAEGSDDEPIDYLVWKH